MSGEKSGCLPTLGETLGMVVAAFLGFWILWSLNAFVLGVYSTFAEDSSGKLLAAVATIGELLILFGLDRVVERRRR